MLRLLSSAAILASLIVPSAVDAATAHRHKKHGSHYRQMRTAPSGLYGSHGYGGKAGYGDYVAPAWSRPIGPPWAGPNQCFEDLGYGRFESCDTD
jgi:hypothetical protein